MVIFEPKNAKRVTRVTRRLPNSQPILKQSERSVHHHAVIPLFRLSQQSF